MKFLAFAKEVYFLIEIAVNVVQIKQLATEKKKKKIRKEIVTDGNHMSRDLWRLPSK